MSRRDATLLLICALALAFAPAGSEAAPMAADAVPEQIASVAVGYADALAAGNRTAAWELLSAASQAELSLAEWQKALAQKPVLRKPPAASMLRAIATAAGGPSVGEVLVMPDEALVEVNGTVEVRQQYVLVREPAGWRVDLGSSDRLNGRQAALTFLDAVREEAALGSQQRPSQEASLSLLRALLAPEAKRYEVVHASVDGDRAEVTVAADVPVNLVLRAVRSGPGWVVDFTRPLVPVDVSSPEPLKDAAELAERTACESRLGALARAVQMYAASSDGMLPDPDRWVDQVRPHLTGVSDFHCPNDETDGFSYAMNRNLAGKRLNQILRPETTVMLFESTLHGTNPADGGESWPEAGRHSAGNMVAYADGKVRPASRKPSFGVATGPARPTTGVVNPGRAVGRPPRAPARMQPR